MNIVVRNIPDGDTCRGCRFLMGPGSIVQAKPDGRHCDIFNVKIATNEDNSEFIKNIKCFEASA